MSSTPLYTRGREDEEEEEEEGEEGEENKITG